MSGGAERLDLVTRLLHRARLTDATAGVWEAADIQWWSRTPRRSDDLATPIWLDQHGPAAAILMTDWGSSWGIDVLRVPAASPDLDEIWVALHEAITTVGAERYDTLVRDDDAELV